MSYLFPAASNNYAGILSFTFQLHTDNYEQFLCIETSDVIAVASGDISDVFKYNGNYICTRSVKPYFIFKLNFSVMITHYVLMCR